MTAILDIHTHHPAPQPEALVCVGPENFNPVDGQLYSVGIHPWETENDITSEKWDLIESAAAHPQVRAIGECGIDRAKGGPLFRQMLVMKRQIELSEKLQKPLVIHNVKAHDVIIGMKKDIRPTQPWMVHGFRGKPSVAQMLADAGNYLSFGPLHNDESVITTPSELMLAETDDADTTVEQVIATLSALRQQEMTDIIKSNSARFLSL